MDNQCWSIRSGGGAKVSSTWLAGRPFQSSLPWQTFKASRSDEAITTQSQSQRGALKVWQLQPAIIRNLSDRNSCLEIRTWQLLTTSLFLKAKAVIVWLTAHSILLLPRRLNDRRAHVSSRWRQYREGCCRAAQLPPARFILFNLSFVPQPWRPYLLHIPVSKRVSKNNKKVK